MDSIDFDGHHYGFNVKRTKYFKINNKISNLRFKRNKFSHMKFYKLETEKMNKEVKSIKFQKWLSNYIIFFIFFKVHP